MSEDLVSEITLEYLMNRDQYAKYVKQKNDKPKKQDKRFYKKRLIDLTKQLLNNEIEPQVFPDIVKGFDSYVKMCIDYFKSLDRRDILQEEYKESSLGEDPLLVTSTVETQPLVDDCVSRLFHIKEPNSLEKIVKRTKLPVKKSSVILPLQKEINLKDPILKNKGIHKNKHINKNIGEKKNITTTYEETSLQKENTKKTSIQPNHEKTIEDHQIKV